MPKLCMLYYAAPCNTLNIIRDGTCPNYTCNAVGHAQIIHTMHGQYTPPLPVFSLINTRYSPFIPVLSIWGVTAVWIKK
jgi:hypothetical protein